MYVCIVMSNYRTVEAKRSPRKHFDSVGHDRHLMQRWLPIEQHLYVCMYVCMYVLRKYTYMYVYTNECMYICMLCMYEYIYYVHACFYSFGLMMEYV